MEACINEFPELITNLVWLLFLLVYEKSSLTVFMMSTQVTMRQQKGNGE